MDPASIKSLIYAEDFRPFRIFHKKGKAYDVPHQDYAWISPIGICVIVDTLPDRQHMEVLCLDWIERISTDVSASRE
jgi:hypothetical protein